MAWTVCMVFGGETTLAEMSSVGRFTLRSELSSALAVVLWHIQTKIQMHLKMPRPEGAAPSLNLQVLQVPPVHSLCAT